MNWLARAYKILKRISRIISLVSLVAMLCVAIWIFWPSYQPSERALLQLVPEDSRVVMLHRDLRQHWPAFRTSQVYRAFLASPFVPVKVETDSLTQKVLEGAMLDLLGNRTVFFAPGDQAAGGCLIVPVTPRLKWLWVRIALSSRLERSGFTIRKVDLDGHAVREIVTKHDLPITVRFARMRNMAAVSFDARGNSLAELFRAIDAKKAGGFGHLASNTNLFHVGEWRQKGGTANWEARKETGGSLHWEVTLPKKRTVRLPWDAHRGPRTMGLVQKLFPDQGMLTARGRASHWMSAWDNLVAWLGLPQELYSEAMLTRTKYREHLSHGQFPWSGAGDEFACVISSPQEFNLAGWPAILLALRCWEPNDTQTALRQFLDSLTYITKNQFLLDPPTSSEPWYSVRAEINGRIHTFFRYRYADGLVLAGNSIEQLKAFDPGKFAKEEMKPVLPENELYCKPVELAESVQLLATAANFLLGPNAGADLNALAAILKGMDETRLAVSVEKETVKYQMAIKVK